MGVIGMDEVFERAAAVGSFGVSSSYTVAGMASSAVIAEVPGCAARTGNGDDIMGSNDFVTIQGGLAATAVTAAPGQPVNNVMIAVATIGASNFCGRYFNAADMATLDGTICSRVAPFKLGVNFDEFEQTAATAAMAKAGKADIQETSTTAGFTEPLGTSGFSL